jgi:hypothetical protein
MITNLSLLESRNKSHYTILQTLQSTRTAKWSIVVHIHHIATLRTYFLLIYSDPNYH